jgi:DNA polymerase III subunit epsilon
MREIIFDTETTGIDARVERIIEIGAIELEHRVPTGRTFHCFLNPDGKPIDPGATAIHGITDAQVRDQPLFRDVIDEFLAFVRDAKLVAHNASFDQGFINAELARLNRAAIPGEQFIDTLAIARRKHPLGPNSLDALCKRYGIDNSRRVHHGALLDAELLAEVYVELAGGRQTALGLTPGDIAKSGYSKSDSKNTGLENTGLENTELENTADQTSGTHLARNGVAGERRLPPRPNPLPPRLTDEERQAHAKLVTGLGEKALWPRYP